MTEKETLMWCIDGGLELTKKLKMQYEKYAASGATIHKMCSKTGLILNSLDLSKRFLERDEINKAREQYYQASTDIKELAVWVGELIHEGDTI